MSAKHWALSAYFVWHIVSTVLGALGASNTVPPVGASRRPPGDALAAALTPVLDEIAAVVGPVQGALTREGSPLWPFTRYLAVTGLSQNWRMFSAPPQEHQYLRVRYYVGPNREISNPVWTATELVLPGHREDELRLFQAYRDSFRDKAITVALSRFHGARADLVRRDTASAELPDDLAPIGRYFARRFEKQALRPDERILRTEIWYGEAPMPPQGSTLDRASTDLRLAVLREYYDGPVQDHLTRPAYPVYHKSEVEADINWVLEYFEP
jgi:hypothetical protein